MNVFKSLFSFSLSLSYIELQYLQLLYDEAVSKGYSSCEVCEELLSAIKEAERCAKTAVQISSGKHRGIVVSISSRGSSSVEKRMDVDELIEFLEQVESLPCSIPEASILQVRGLCASNNHFTGA